MKKLEIAALALSVVSVAGVLFAVSEARVAGSGIGALTERVAKLESAAPAPGPSAVSPTNADLSRDIASLRAQVTALAGRPLNPAAGPGSRFPADPAVSEEAANKAKAEDAARQQAWLESMSRSIVSNLTTSLDLSAQQVSQVSDVVNAQLEGFRQARLHKSNDEIKAALSALYADTNDKVKQLLTSEQQARFDEIAKRPGGIFTLQPVGARSGTMVRPGGGNVQGR